MGRLPKLKRSLRQSIGTAVHRTGGATRSDIAELRRDLDAAVGQITARIDWLGKRVDALEEREARDSQALEDLKNRAAIEAVTRWIRYATLHAQPLISVVLPTRDRPELLERAINSVIAQRYENWELLVADDGRTGDSRSVVDALGDTRVSWSRNPGAGLCAARNHALGRAKGELIAYLDDDNMMDRYWLYALAWAFQQRPDIDVVYGAYVVDDWLRISGESSGALPWTFMNSWSREALEQSNLADIGAIGHRAALPEAWFDESLRDLEDWDLLVRLTGDKDPLVLPAIAHYYTTDAPDRNKQGPSYQETVATVRARAQSRA